MWYYNIIRMHNLYFLPDNVVKPSHGLSKILAYKYRYNEFHFYFKRI